VRLRELRLLKGLKQSELAQLLGVSANTVSGWENGYNEMDYNTLKTASQIFDVSIDYLIENDYDLKPLNDREQEILNIYRNLSHRSRSLFIKIINLIKDYDK
jgi:transcriptional regulator with XRE-family HTH domain